jgi:hypothetical protein
MFTVVPPDLIGYMFTVHIHIATSYNSKVEAEASFIMSVPNDNGRNNRSAQKQRYLISKVPWVVKIKGDVVPVFIAVHLYH